MGNKGKGDSVFGRRGKISFGICRRCKDIIKVDVEGAGVEVCELAAVGWANGSVAGSCECGKETSGNFWLAVFG